MHARSTPRAFALPPLHPTDALMHDDGMYEHGVVARRLRARGHAESDDDPPSGGGASGGADRPVVPFVSAQWSALHDGTGSSSVERLTARDVAAFAPGASDDAAAHGERCGGGSAPAEGGLRAVRLAVRWIGVGTVNQPPPDAHGAAWVSFDEEKPLLGALEVLRASDAPPPAQGDNAGADAEAAGSANAAGAAAAAAAGAGEGEAAREAAEAAADAVDAAAAVEEVVEETAGVDESADEVAVAGSGASSSAAAVADETAGAAASGADGEANGEGVRYRLYFALDVLPEEEGGRWDPAAPASTLPSGGGRVGEPSRDATSPVPTAPNLVAASTAPPPLPSVAEVRALRREIGASVAASGDCLDALLLLGKLLT
jgi:hypothetical protein